MLELNKRNRPGVDDFVLLENYTSEDAFIENLRIRYASEIIYVRMNTLFLNDRSEFRIFTDFEQTFIGPVLVSVNPYKKLHIYNEEFMNEYKNSHLFELHPHL